MVLFLQMATNILTSVGRHSKLFSDSDVSRPFERFSQLSSQLLLVRTPGLMPHRQGQTASEAARVSPRNADQYS
jgi:hypothetical protein